MIIRTRFAPSPTGNLHLGGIRTALYNWLYAQHNGGEFILRIEDTDQGRSTKEATQIILDSMNWLGLNYNSGPFYQTDRLDYYQQTAEKLIMSNHAYRCYCSKDKLDRLRKQQLNNHEKPRYDGCCRDKSLPRNNKQPYVIRFRNERNGTVKVDDQVLGLLSFQNSELDDLIIVRSDGLPTYNFCVVVDDLAMRITHVIRGADHVNNTPRQINIFRALGAEPPIYAHVPLILNRDGKLLSKRHGAVSVLQYRNDGFLPEALLNYLVRLGWSYGNQEIFSQKEMIELFDIKNINKAAASFDPKKLLWFNCHYIKTLDSKLIENHLKPFMQELKINTTNNGPTLDNVILALRERVKTINELAIKSRIFYENLVHYEDEAKQYLNLEIIPYLKIFKLGVENITSWNDDSLHKLIIETARQLDVSLGKIAQSIRVIVTGSTISPPLNVTLRLIGKQKVLRRLNDTLKHLTNQ
jgi:glutamyl-tRNA synthetase